MAIGKSYPKDNRIQDADLFLGTKASTLSTVNYTAQSVSDYLNNKGKISIGGQMVFQFVTANPSNGTISLPLEGGDGDSFSSITNLIVSTTDFSTQNVVNFIDYIIGSEILLTEQNQISTFGNYKITQYEVTIDPGFYNLTLEYIGGYGSINKDLFYDLTFFRTSSGGSSIVLTTNGNSGPSTLIGNILNIPEYAEGSSYVLPIASETVLGGVKIGEGINIAIDGIISVSTNYQAPLSGSGIVKSTAGTITYISGLSSEFIKGDGSLDASTYLTGITSLDVTTALRYTPVTNAITLTINGVTYDLTVDRSWTIATGSGTVTSVGLTVPSAFSVTPSAITTSGTFAITGAGTASQYVRGDGQLATFPSGGGGGSSVNYYLNGSIAASVATYKKMSNTAIIGAGTDFTLTGNGLIAQFLTDVGNPNRIEIPGGAWNFEMFFSMSSGGGTPKFYIELLKYNGTTFTSIASSSATPETISGGTIIDLYLTSLAVPTTSLLVTDRLAVRVYIVDSTGGKTATLHTEDSHLCEIITTFSGGVTSLNGLTANTQYLAVGTSGTDFTINSLLDTHTFNLPNAGPIARGVITTLAQTIAGEKTFTDGIKIGVNTRIFEFGASTFINNLTAGYTFYVGGGPTFQQNNLSVPNGTFNIALQTASTIASFDASKNVVSLPLATYPSLTELSYVKGVTSAIQTQINAVNVNVITITTAVSITTDTTNGTYGQHGRHNKISNGANAINIECVSTSNADFVASYEKIGTSTITFTAGAGITLTTLSGTAAMSGVAGSKACLSRNGSIYYLQITNY